MSRLKYRYSSLLTSSVIKAATKGDAEAVDAVLKHYSLYISKLAMRRLYDENGWSMMCVDESLRQRLESKLMSAILRFRVEEPEDSSGE